MKCKFYFGNPCPRVTQLQGHMCVIVSHRKHMGEFLIEKIKWTNSLQIRLYCYKHVICVSTKIDLLLIMKRKQEMPQSNTLEGRELLLKNVKLTHNSTPDVMI